MSRLTIEVGRLVFHGLDADAAARAGAAFSAELERLALQRGLSRPAPTPELTRRAGAGARAEDIGRAAAARVHARIAR